MAAIAIQSTLRVCGRHGEDLEDNGVSNDAYRRVGAPDPSCNLNTMLKTVYPESGNWSKLATFSRPHLPAPSNIRWAGNVFDIAASKLAQSVPTPTISLKLKQIEQI